jgi:hypothetical protein
MSKPVTLPTTSFNALSGNQPASLLDADFAALLNAQNDIITYSNGFDDTGAVNAYVVTIAAPLTFALTKYVRVQFKVTNTNTGASTLNVNAGGAVAIFNQSGSALVGGELQAGRIVEVQYDGTQWQLLSSATATAALNIPTIQVFTTVGASTYTRPAGLKYAEVWMRGSGGGGGGQGAGTSAGGTGGTSTFGGLLQCIGGGGGQDGGGAPVRGGGIGGTGGTGGSYHTPGAPGMPGAVGSSANGGGSGGGEGAGPGGSNAGANGVRGGGGAGGGGVLSSTCGGGGGQGEWGYGIFSAATLGASLTVTLGAAGTAGAGTLTGGSGGVGYCIVRESYS